MLKQLQLYHVQCYVQIINIINNYLKTFKL